jgi:hypothetical protein
MAIRRSNASDERVLLSAEAAVSIRVRKTAVLLLEHRPAPGGDTIELSG